MWVGYCGLSPLLNSGSYVVTFFHVPSSLGVSSQGSNKPTMGISSWQICWLSLRYLEQKIVKDICSCGLLKDRRNVEKIEEAQDIVFDVHSRGIVAERKISTQGPKLPVLSSGLPRQRTIDGQKRKRSGGFLRLRGPVDFQSNGPGI